MRIRVCEICPDSRVTRQDGARLRETIVRSWSAEEPLDIDFEGKTIASVSFLDEAIAVLILDHGPEVVRSRLHLVDLTDGDRRVLNQQVAHRLQQRSEGLRSAGTE